MHAGLRGSFWKKKGGGDASNLLDTYAGALGAYSLRRLRSDYSGDLVAIRRSSDDDEDVFPLVGDVLPIATVESFLGGADGFVSWYDDQSSASKPISQASFGSQPRIATAGSVLVDSNGNPYMSWDGVNDYLFTTSKLGLTDHDNILVSAVINKDFVSTADPITESSSVNSQPIFRSMYFTGVTNGGVYVRNDAGGIIFNGGFGDFNDNSWSIINNSFRKSSEWRVRLNGAFSTEYAYNFTGSFTANRFAIGAMVRASVSGYAKFLGQEFVFWNGDYYTDQEAIETSQNNYYNHF